MMGGGVSGSAEQRDWEAARAFIANLSGPGQKIKMPEFAQVS